MSEDKKRLSHRIEVLDQEKAQMHNSNLQLQAMVENMRRHLGSLQAQLHRDNDWSRKALNSFSELSADMSSEISSSNSSREFSIARATRMAEKRASLLAAASKRDELGENISEVAGRFAQLDRANSRMLAQLSKTEEEMKEFRAQNHQGKSREDATTDNIAAMQNRVKFLETQLSALLNERNIYRDRCETMSEKMKKQASDVLDRLSSSNNHDNVRHWSIQTGGIKVLRIDSGATAERRSDRSSDTGEKNKASATEIKAEDVQILDKLAEGTFGVIHRAKWLSALVAVKKLRAYTSSMTPQEVEAMAIDFRREVHQLTHLRHPNILSFYGTFSEAGAIAIVTGWTPKCKCSRALLSLFIRILTFSEN
jgi:chromosome segregation ATPase